MLRTGGTLSSPTGRPGAPPGCDTDHHEQRAGRRQAHMPTRGGGQGSERSSGYRSTSKSLPPNCAARRQPPSPTNRRLKTSMSSSRSSTRSPPPSRRCAGTKLLSPSAGSGIPPLPTATGPARGLPGQSRDPHCHPRARPHQGTLARHGHRPGKDRARVLSVVANLAPDRSSASVPRRCRSPGARPSDATFERRPRPTRQARPARPVTGRRGQVPAHRTTTVRVQQYCRLLRVAHDPTGRPLTLRHCELACHCGDL